MEGREGEKKEEGKRRSERGERERGKVRREIGTREREREKSEYVSDFKLEVKFMSFHKRWWRK